MLITCPSCTATYDLPTDRIGAAGRKVRCVSCRESWFVTANSDDREPQDAKPSLDEEIAIEIVARPLQPQAAPPSDPAPRGKRRGKRRAAKPVPRMVGARYAKIAALLFVGIAPLALYSFREGIVSTMPGTASLYRSVGLPINLIGLSFQKVASQLSDESGATVLQVTGEIVNDGRSARQVPWLHIALEGEQGEALYSWSAKAAEGELAVGKSAPFRVRLTAPPTGAKRIAVTFRETRTRRTAALD